MRPDTHELLARLTALLEDSDGEIDGEIDALMGGLAHDARGLADWYGRSIRRMSAQASACADEAAFWSDKARRYESRAARLKTRALDDMRMLGAREVQTDLFTLRIQPSPPRVRMEDVPPERLPEWAQRVKVEADKSEIKRRLQAGETLDFAWLEAGEHLRIR